MQNMQNMPQGHKSSFTNPNKKGETKLSTHIWELKARGSTFDVKWKVLDRGAPFTPVTGRCNLCTKEKFYILKNQRLLLLTRGRRSATIVVTSPCLSSQMLGK